MNFRYTPIDVFAGTGVVRLVDSTAMVQWSSAGDLRPLDTYISERVQLLVRSTVKNERPE